MKNLLLTFTTLCFLNTAFAADVKTEPKPAANIKTIITSAKGEKYTNEKTGTFVEITPFSTVAIDLNSEPESIELSVGMIRARIAKATSDKKASKPKFLLKTKTATMDVRGTDFMAVVNPILDESEIIVFEGKVDLSSTANPKEMKTIPAGKWGGIGGRFGTKIHEPIALSESALEYYDNVSTLK
jgi:hypothetical protein